MASAKALAAIALTLIIAVPIMLGYAMASENVSYTDWEAESNVNLSNQILNSSTPYTIENMGPTNNSRLLQEWRFPGEGVTEYHAVAPAYRLVSENYSSIPEYTSSNSNINMTAATTATYSLEYNGSIVSVGTSESSPTYSVIHKDLYYIGIETTGPMPLHWAFMTDQGSTSLTEATITIVRDGSDSWTAIVNGSTTITDIAWWKVATDYSGDVTIASRSYTALSPGSVYTFNTAPDMITGLQLYSSSTSSTYYTYTDDQALVSFSGGDVMVGTDSYANISQISVVYPASFSVVTVTTPTATGRYADPAEGWTVPDPNTPYYSWWSNGHQNTSVDMMIKFTGAATVYLSPTNGMTHNAGTYTVAYDANGIVKINNQSLGAYTAIEAVFTSDGATFYGISEWPNMTQTPTRLNYLEFTNTHGLFTSIEINGSGGTAFNYVSFRVDRADIVAGSFPSTKDYTLDMNGLFPGKSYALKLNSIGIYGDTLTVGTHSYSITNGRITVDGDTVSLKGLIITSRYNGSSYDVSIGAHSLGTSATPVSVTFGGEWSLTVTAQTLKQVTGEKAEWTPGGFAFDKDAFAGVIVLIAALTFIGVGMYGARSGIKAGLLLMICGGAALIALTL